MNDDQPGTVLGRFEREREQAERRYVAALVALDAAATEQPAVADAVSAADADVARLTQIWHNHQPPSAPQSFFGRMMAELGRMLPWRRRAFHGALLAAVSRQAAATRALFDAQRHFQSHVIWYAQTIGNFAGNQRGGSGAAADAQSVAAMHAAVSALATDWQLHWDSLKTRDHRFDARMDALSRAYEDLRDASALVDQRSLALKRAVEGLRTGAPATALSTAPPSSSATPSVPALATAGVDIDAFKYLAFEDRFRGSREEIRRRLSDYPPLFAGARAVLDIGCGRGELLDLFREHGVDARGIDVNDEMVEACRARGLSAERADALAYLSAQPDGSLGGLIAIQVVEHLEPPYLMRLIETAHHKLAPGAPMVLETINAACWAAFFDSYIRDFTHVRPLHPDTLRYLVQASGFTNADVQFRSEFPPQDRLRTVSLPAAPPNTPEQTAIAELSEAVNAQAERLNAQLFTHRDFAIVARR
jgi:SAM-dependent methyltransferase